jgi:hypothetical protein
MEMNLKAHKTVLDGMSGLFERSMGIQKETSQKKKKCATELFQVTKGNHDLLLKHEQEKNKDEEEKAQVQEEKRKLQEMRKRKREEEQEDKEHQRREREKK